MRKEIKDKIENSHINQVDLDHLHIEDHEIEEIMHSIQQLRPHLQQIFLSNNKLSDRGAKILGEKLSFFPELTFLDLQFNHIDKPGARGVFSLLSKKPTLNIAFHGNKMTDQGELQKIVDAAVKK